MIFDKLNIPLNEEVNLMEMISDPTFWGFFGSYSALAAIFIIFILLILTTLSGLLR